MRPSRWILPALAACAAMGQTTPPNFAGRRAAYQSALDDLAKTDPRLERDLNAAPPGELLQRIAGRQKRSELLTQAGLDLYESMRSGLEQCLAVLPPKGRSNPEVLGKTVEDELKAIRDEMAVVDQDIQANKDAGVSLALADQEEELKHFESNLLKEQARLARSSESAAQVDAAVDHIRESMRVLLAELADAQERMRSIGAQRSQYYAELRAMVATRETPAGNPLVGTWEAAESSSTIPTRSIQLRMATTGDRLQGTLRIDSQPPAGSQIPSHIVARIMDEAASTGPFAILIGNALPAALSLTPAGGKLNMVVTFNNGSPFRALLRHPAEQAEAAANPLLGTWRGDGKFSAVPAQSMELRMALAGGQLQGTLTIECRPPANSKLPAHLVLRFDAPPKSTGPFPVAVGGSQGRITITAESNRLVVVVDADGTADFVGYLDRVTE
jgi:hypothetical protein